MKLNQLVCFSKGTKVLLSNGKEKDIENINIGDEILTYNIFKTAIESSKVEKVASSYHSVINIVHYNNGIKLMSTLDHPLYVISKGWASFNPQMTYNNYSLNVEQLDIGDNCLYLEKDTLTKISVVDIEVKVDNQKMYVISGGKNNSFFANGIVASDEFLMNLRMEEHNVEFKIKR